MGWWHHTAKPWSIWWLIVVCAHWKQSGHFLMVFLTIIHGRLRRICVIPVERCACSNNSANTSTHCSSILLLTSASIDLEIALFRASLFTWPFIAWTARWGGIPLCCTYHKIKNGTDGDHHRREFFTKNIAYRHDKKTKKQQEDGHQTTINLTMYKAVATSPLHMGAVVFLVFADDMALERLGGSIVPL